MPSSRFYLILLICCFITLTTCNPIPRPFSGSKKKSDGNNTLKIPVTELYRILPIDEVPTTIAPDVRLSNKTRTRYGYSFGRPVSRVERFLDSRFGSIFKPLVSGIMRKFPEILHWGLLVSTSPPFNDRDRIPKPGKWVPSPQVGIIFELRNSGNNNLVYLDIKNWTSYQDT